MPLECLRSTFEVWRLFPTKANTLAHVCKPSLIDRCHPSQSLEVTLGYNERRLDSSLY
jgi:hypothetical protein